MKGGLEDVEDSKGEGCGRGVPPPALKCLGITNICIHEKCMDNKSCINLQT